MTTPDTLILDVLSKIKFRLLRPEQGGPPSGDIKVAEAYTAFDVSNTVLEDPDTPLMRLELLRTPRMSTVAIGYLLNRLVRAMPDDHQYLNIGVWCGFSFFCGMIGNNDKRCVGVDSFVDPAGTRNIFDLGYQTHRTPRTEFHAIDYEAYFRSFHRGPIGVYFYDGDHRYEHQLRALELASPHLAPGAYVLVDDTNDLEPRQATIDFLGRHAGEFELVMDQSTANNGHPTFWNGLMVLRKRS